MWIHRIPHSRGVFLFCDFDFSARQATNRVPELRQTTCGRLGIRLDEFPFRRESKDMCWHESGAAPVRYECGQIGPQRSAKFGPYRVRNDDRHLDYPARASGRGPDLPTVFHGSFEHYYHI